MVTPNIILTPWQEDLVRKSGGLISRAQAAKMSPSGVPVSVSDPIGFGGLADRLSANQEDLRRRNLSEVDRLTEDIQADMAKNPDKYKAMPDSQARAEQERLVSEGRGEASLQQQLAETQARRDAEQKAAFAQIQAELAARRERVGDPTVVSSDPMTYQDEYDAARQDEAKPDPAYQVGVTKDVARINEA